jgi:hypothetical protein
MPQVLGIQYTGTRLFARPNQKVLEYLSRGKTRQNKSPEQKIGGFAPKS